MLLYNLTVRSYALGIRISSFNNPKARQWVTGRKNWEQTLEQKISDLGLGNRIWFHCASYGEFEQGRPLMEAVKIKNPGCKIILSFFSPSGYEAFKSWSGADAVCYLPLDTKANAKRFIQLLKPQTVLFIKYEFWLNFLFELKRQNIATYLVSAVFKEHHPFFKWYGGIFRKSLQTFKKLFIQDNISAKLLEQIGITNYEVCGDTRFDRVLKVRENFSELEVIKKFKGDCKLIVAGSTWFKDEDLVLNSFTNLKAPNTKLVLVPHEVGEASIGTTVEKIKALNLTYALYNGSIKGDEQVLVVNLIGVLSKIYFYADCAYIGGGFNGGLHNTLEPAVYGIPVAFYAGNEEKYNEVIELLNIGAGFKVNGPQDLTSVFQMAITDDKKRKEISEELSLFFDKNSKVTERIVSSVFD